MLGGGTIEAERFVEFTVVVDPSPDSALMQVTKTPLQVVGNPSDRGYAFVLQVHLLFPSKAAEAAASPVSVQGEEAQSGCWHRKHNFFHRHERA